MFNWMLLILVSLTAPSALVYAKGGADGGGGGVGVRCDGSKLELLDRHEAQFESLTIAANPQNQEEAIALASQLLAKHFWNPETIPVNQLKEHMREHLIEPFFYQGNIQDAETGKQITFNKVEYLFLSQDIAPFKIAAGCRLEQIVYFDDSLLLMHIDMKKWNELGWLDKAMLAAHEMAYFFNRRDGLEGRLANKDQSIQATQTRLFVRKLFSTEPPMSLKADLPSDALRCQSVVSDLSEFIKFYVYQRDGKTTAMFSNFLKRMSFYQIKSDMGAININSLMNIGDEFSASTVRLTIPEGGDLHFTLSKGKNQNPSVQLKFFGDKALEPIPVACEKI